MNYKFNLGNVSFKMAGQGEVEIKDIGVEVTDFNLKDIPSIIKETRKAFKDVKSLFEEGQSTSTFEETLFEQTFMSANGAEGHPEGFGAFAEFLRGMEQANAAHSENEEEECGCGHLDCSLAQIVQEAIQAKHPGAHIIQTPQGLAVAIPKGANE